MATAGVPTPRGLDVRFRHERRRRVEHPTKPGPTRPYSNALKELGITVDGDPIA